MPHGHVSLKMQNIESVFDEGVLGDFKRRKFDGRMDLTSNRKVDITSNKLGRFGLSMGYLIDTQMSLYKVEFLVFE